METILLSFVGWTVIGAIIMVLYAYLEEKFNLNFAERKWFVGTACVVFGPLFWMFAIFVHIVFKNK